MTQEKQRLRQEFSERLTYGVICNTSKGDGHLCSINQTIFGTEYGINIKATERDYFNDSEEVIKPYLRPMSSMTDEERLNMTKEIEGLKIQYFASIPWEWSVCGLVTTNTLIQVVDWLNAHHFDYRGLIEKGLAIAVTDDNNPYKE